MDISSGVSAWLNRSAAAISMPGVQIPHWAAPWRWNESWRAASRPPASTSPSTVMTSRPATCPTGVMQEHTCRPSSNTVQAPQSPASQPTLVPVSARSSRSTWTSLRIGSTPTSAGFPLSVNAIISGAVIIGSQAPAADDGPASRRHPSGIQRYRARHRSATTRPGARQRPPRALWRPTADR